MTVDINLKNQVIALITLLKAKAEKNDAKPTIKTKSVINILKSTGMILSYSQLSEIFDDPTVKPMVKDFNKDRITLYSNDEEPEQPEEGEFGAENALDDNAGLDGELDAAEDGLGGPEEETGPLDITRPAPAQPPAPMQQSAIPEAPPGPATVASMAKRALARG